MVEVDLDARLDALFANEPKVFTAARDALVRDLKAAGRADEGAEVKALRKPTVAVAAVNRAAREHPADVAELVELGADLSALQSDAGAERDELRDLTRRRRALLQGLTERAASTIERPDGARSSIAATLDAASLDPVLRDDLQRGRLTQELSPAARFVTDGTPGPRATPRRRGGATRTPPPRDELAVRRARTELAAVRERADEAAESVRQHAEATTATAERLAVAHRHVIELEAALADARAEVADATRAERDAQRATRRAHIEQERVEVALVAAQRAVDETT